METKTVFSGQTSFQKVGNPAQFFRLPETAFRENKLSRRVSFPAPFPKIATKLTAVRRVRLRTTNGCVYDSLIPSRRHKAGTL